MQKRILGDDCVRNDCSFRGSCSNDAVAVVVVVGKSKKQKNFEDVAKESEIIQ